MIYSHSTTMTAQKFELHSEFKPSGDQPAAIQQLIEGVNHGLAYQTLLGVTGSGKTFTMANVMLAIQRPTLILAPNKTLAAQLYGEMKEFFPKNAVEYFVSYYDYYQPEAYVPSSDTYIAKDASINEHIEQMRLSATKALLDRGDKIDHRRLLRRLAELQYTRNDVDLYRATYRVRGDVIDVYPAESDREAVRIELLDDEIENLAFFDPLTGEISRRVPRLTIYPKSHYVTPRERVIEAIDQIKIDLKIRLEELRNLNKLVET